MFLFNCGLILFSLFSQVHSQGSSISFSPDSSLCLGEEVEMVCFVETTDAFGIPTAFVSINSSRPFSTVELNGNTVEDGIDLSRYSASIDGLTITTNRPGIRLIVRSYQTSDSATLFGCHGFFSNTTLSSALVSQPPPSDLAVPPSSPSLSTSLSTLSASECQGVSVSWLAPATDRAITQYYLYRNSSLISTLSNTTTQYTDTDPLMLNAAYLYSLAAASCAGNSTMGSATAVITGYGLMMAANSICLHYNSVSNMITLIWDFSAPTPTTTLLIEYSLTLNYSHTQGNETRTFSDSTLFSLLSSDARTSTQSLIPHSFVGGVEVETNITAVLRITQQCGQSYSGTQISCSISSIYLLPPNTPTQTCTPIQSSSVPSPSAMTTNITSTTTPICTGIPCSNTESSQLIILNVIFGSLFFIALIINAVLILVIIFISRKNKQLNSSLTVKPAPSHPYEYIDLDKVSGNISSPTQQQSPQDYVPMSSVHKQDPTKPPPFYANLK